MVEGCDGTGKSTLVARLGLDLDLPIHDRASDSIGGPVPNVYEWALRDVASWDNQTLALYDRHPFVSELIYGPIVRGKLDDQFFSYKGFRARRAFRKDALVIFCKLPWEVVMSNLTKSPTSQMPGVMDNAKRLWLLYQVFFSEFVNEPGSSLKVWDYTEPDYDGILNECEAHVARWNGAEK